VGAVVAQHAARVAEQQAAVGQGEHIVVARVGVVMLGAEALQQRLAVQRVGSRRRQGEEPRQDHQQAQEGRHG
jgi:hypothetical protein